MQAAVADQARQAVAEADVVLLVIDARAGLAAGDKEIASILRRSGRPVVVVANKLDDGGHEQAALELHSLVWGTRCRSRRCTGAAWSMCSTGCAQAPRARPGAGAGAVRSHPGRNPGAAECRQVVASECDFGPAAGDRLTGAGDNPRSNRYQLRAQRCPFPAGRHRRASAQAPPPPGDRVLQRGAHHGGRRPGRRGTGLDRRLGGRHRRRSVRRRRGPQGRLRDAGGAFQVGYLDGHRGRRRRPAQRQVAPASGDGHHILSDGT